MVHPDCVSTHCLKFFNCIALTHAFDSIIERLGHERIGQDLLDNLLGREGPEALEIARQYTVGHNVFMNGVRIFDFETC